MYTPNEYGRGVTVLRMNICIVCIVKIYTRFICMHTLEFAWKLVVLCSAITVFVAHALQMLIYLMLPIPAAIYTQFFL